MNEDELRAEVERLRRELAAVKADRDDAQAAYLLASRERAVLEERARAARHAISALDPAMESRIIVPPCETEWTENVVGEIDHIACVLRKGHAGPCTSAYGTHPPSIGALTGDAVADLTRERDEARAALAAAQARLATEDRLRALAARAVGQWGPRRQLRMTQEECCELAVAVSHHMRTRAGSLAELTHEAADVRVCLEYARSLAPEEYDAALVRALDRLEALLEENDNG